MRRSRSGPPSATPGSGHMRAAIAALAPAPRGRDAARRLLRDGRRGDAQPGVAGLLGESRAVRGTFVATAPRRSIRLLVWRGAPAPPARLASRRRPDRPARDRAASSRPAGRRPGFTLRPGPAPGAVGRGCGVRVGGALGLRRAPRPPASSSAPPGSPSPPPRRLRRARPALAPPGASSSPSAGGNQLEVREEPALSEEPVHLRHPVGPARPCRPERSDVGGHVRDPAGDRDEARHVRHDHRRSGLRGRLRRRRLRRLLGPEASPSTTTSSSPTSAGPGCRT